MSNLFSWIGVVEPSLMTSGLLLLLIVCWYDTFDVPIVVGWYLLVHIRFYICVLVLAFELELSFLVSPICPTLFCGI